MKRPPKKLYALSCGACGKYIASEATKALLRQWGSDNCPPSHYDTDPIVTGPYVLAPKKETTR